MLDLFGNRQERRRLAAALCLMAAEAAGFAMGGAGELLLLSSIFAAIFAIAAFGWSSRTMAYASIVSAGLALAGLCGFRERKFMEAHSMNGVNTTLLLKVDSPPAVKEGARGGNFATFQSYRDGVRLKVVMPLKDGDKAPSPGETWKCTGRVGLGRTMWCSKGECHIVAGAGPGLYGFYSSLNMKLSHHLETGLSRFPDLSALNKGLLLGCKDSIPKNLMRDFRSSGIAHILAVSGLHVMFIVAMMRSILCFARLPGNVSALIAAAPIAAYVLLTGAKASAARAGVMAILFLGSEALERERSSILWWSTAAILLYSMNPEWVLDAGSTLSFTVMLGIMLWLRSTGGLMARFAPFMERHPKVKKTVTLYSVGFAAWVSGAPISAMYFGTMTPAGLIAGPPAVVLAGFEMAFSALGALLGYIYGPLATLGNIPAALAALGEVAIAKAGAAIPFGHFKVEGWGIAATILWYGLFLLLMEALRRIGLRKGRIRCL